MNGEIIDWDYLQQNSNDVLAEGLSCLLEACACKFDDRHPSEPGNYVISYSGIPLYIGETKRLDRRLVQHYRGNTFYTNYLRDCAELNLPPDLTIDDFKCQFIPTHIGRKEIEEFGIVNLPAPLNNFHINIGKYFTIVSSDQVWQIVQENTENLLEQGEKILLSLEPLPWNQANPPASPGVYIIFNDHEEVIYIGESTDLEDRYRTHSKRTRFSVFRRHVATRIFGFTLKTRAELGLGGTDTKRAYLADSEDKEINKYIHKCSIIMMPVYFGRLELEEHLIQNIQPLLNII